MAEVILRDVVKTYGEVVAVDRVSLTVEDGHFVALVGPSGCGKTTTLNLIAGLIELTAGEILIGERDVSELDPKDRDIAMVFQNYALYPTKSVYANLEFPLKMRGTPKSERDTRIRQTAELLSITPLLNRRPRELSGGQQQRVALGRALVRNPKAFLMDEPLSNLDAKLRVQMRAELKRFHQDLRATVVYVTHDQLEAMTMADKIAVMHGGLLQQYASPDEIYNRPVNTFVAGFIGSPAMNMLSGTFDGSGAIQGDGWRIPLSAANAYRAANSSGAVIAGVRHNHVKLAHEQTSGDQAQPGKIYTVEPTGDVTFVHLRLGDQILIASVEPSFRASLDQTVWVNFDQEFLHLFDAQTQMALPAAPSSDGIQVPGSMTAAQVAAPA
jgi:multiple sugar transport system ATP-binding protein